MVSLPAPTLYVWLNLAGARHVLCMLMIFNCHLAWGLELNQANEAELDSLKGMGPSLSRKVLAARDIRPFASWADFRHRVSGIGAAKAKHFSEQGLTIAGQAFASDQAAP